MMKQKSYLIFGIIGVLVVIGIIATVFIMRNQAAPFCDKEENCCVEDKDCEYIWYTGGCYTPEYVAKVQKEAQEQGRLIGEASPRENVTCSCENNKCVTHN